MRSIAVFVEDAADERVLDVLIRRVAREFALPIELIWANTRDGHGAVVRELKQFLRDLQRGRGAFPDLIVVATDSNCMGFTRRRKEITDQTDKISARVICAIPDPHIERWLMIDGAAFKTVLGMGCDAPDQKCDRKRYKKMLVDAIRRSGVFPTLGGIEYAEAITAELDLERAASGDASLARFVGDLRSAFREWQM
jgi:hypothetical protein